MNITFKQFPAFGGQILNNDNTKYVLNIREKLSGIQRNGIALNEDCICKFPPDTTPVLQTKDKRYKISISSEGNNLLISEEANREIIKKIIITPENDVLEYNNTIDDIIDIKQNSAEVDMINQFTTRVLRVFLK